MIVAVIATGLLGEAVGFGGDADATAATGVPAGTQALFDRARQIADPWVVQIITVGGVQPADPSLTIGPGRPADKDKPDRPRQAPGVFRDDLGSDFQVADGPTTGLVYSADGLILTSSFNFVREPSVVAVTLADGRQFSARIVGRDQVRKLALLKIDADGLPVPQWAPREQVRPGQWAIAIGRGHGGATGTMTVGIISAVGRMMGNAIQTDARLSPVNYGGPLVDVDGRVMGICVPMAQRPGELAGVELYDSGIGFAVPAWRAPEVVERIKAEGGIYRGWLGIQVDPQAERGVQILRLADPSPLRTAGARPGDQIVEINGRPIEHYGQMVNALYLLSAGETAHIVLRRGSEQLDLKATLVRSEELGALPPIEEPPDASRFTPPPPTEPPDD